MPRDRQGKFHSAGWPQRKGQDEQLEAFLAEAFLAGLSTRDLARSAEKHGGHKYDSPQVSRIVARASEDFEAWRQRSLDATVDKFLYLDGANFRVRINGPVSRQSFCAVLGVSEENECFEVVAIEMGAREKADLWESVLRHLRERGWRHEAVQLGVRDGLPGREQLCGRYFPRAQTQRCQKHAQANACRPVRQREREEFSQDLNKISMLRGKAKRVRLFMNARPRGASRFRAPWRSSRRISMPCCASFRLTRPTGRSYERPIRLHV